MPRNQTLFFATADDLHLILDKLEDLFPLQYTPAGIFKDSKPLMYLSNRNIPDLGIAKHRTAISNPQYLASLRGIEVLPREIHLNAGGIVFAIDQLKNKKSIVIRPSVKYDSTTFLGGMVGTISDTDESRNLYKDASRIIKKSFTKVEEFYVGPEALDLLNGGARFTLGVSSPPQYDLKPYK